MILVPRPLVFAEGPFFVLDPIVLHFLLIAIMLLMKSLKNEKVDILGVDILDNNKKNA